MLAVILINMSLSKISTTSASKNFITLKSSEKREFLISGEFITEKSDFSLDFDSSLSEKFSNCYKELGNKEKKLIENLKALDASLIPDDSDSISVLKVLPQEEARFEARKEEIVPPRSLMMENSQYKGKWWCYNCIHTDGKAQSSCLII
jgi:hypothetical protein